MRKSECVELVQEKLLGLLQPACTEKGISLKLMPTDLDAGVSRQASILLFVTGYSAESTTRSGSPVSTRQTGTVTVEAYLIVIAASRVGPRSAEWAAGVASEALDAAEIGDSRVYVDSLVFTSFKNGMWQYRLPVSVALPYSEPQATKAAALISW